MTRALHRLILLTGTALLPLLAAGCGPEQIKIPTVVSNSISGAVTIEFYDYQGVKVASFQAAGNKTTSKTVTMTIDEKVNVWVKGSGGTVLGGRTISDATLIDWTTHELDIAILPGSQVFINVNPR